ncbi:hypothetical protein GEU84_006015 [Fertoebacter nigrum]|uniref:Uncharacterized protein n=1 Tax=Fertoeibacter niger TaxID=2656921 RepID=A0A8X8KQC9_9RHOB|nr:hypothetical protein [Fertoeibacter niger]NUB43927.1 hypothetical protein [Fertoeibacter niger]
MSGIGHNRGPGLTEGTGWRLHCWQKARADLLPHLPLEVLRLRVRRAQELGLDYRTYASVRAATGHDVVAFLFSSNALRVLAQRPALPQDRAAKLAALLNCGRLALAQAPLTPQGLLAAAPALIDAAHAAPAALGSFAQTRDGLRAALGRLPGDTVLLVGDTALEQDWCVAGRLAGYLPADRYFGQG